MGCNPPGSSGHGIFQTRILVWVAIPFFRGIFPTQELNSGLLHCRQILMVIRATRETLNQVPLFPKAVTTNCHKMLAENKRNLFHHTSRGQKKRTKAWAGLAPSAGSEGGSVPCSSPVPCGQQPLALLGIAIYICLPLAFSFLCSCLKSLSPFSYKDTSYWIYSPP